MDVWHLESGVNRTRSRNEGFRSEAKEGERGEFDGASSGCAILQHLYRNAALKLQQASWESVPRSMSQLAFFGQLDSQTVLIRLASVRSSSLCQAI